MAAELRERKILVTGAAQGLGLGIARVLARWGARVALVDRDPKVVQAANEEAFSGRASALISDLGEPEAPRKVISWAWETMGSLNGLVNCAAWSFHKEFLKTTVEDFDRVVAVNQRAPYFLTQAFAARHTNSNEDACVVNIASVNAIAGNPNLTAYAATKGALVAMGRGIAVELAPRVRVVTISPGAVLTKYTEDLIAQGRIIPKELLDRTLANRFIAVEEIGELVAFLFGPAAKSVTGCNWVFDSGYMAQ